MKLEMKYINEFKLLVAGGGQSSCRKIEDHCRAIDFIQKVFFASNFLDVLWRLKNQSFSALVLDIDFEDRPLKNILTELKKQEPKLFHATLLVSSSSTPNVLEEAIDMGARAFLVKPFDYSQLYYKLLHLRD